MSSTVSRSTVNIAVTALFTAIITVSSFITIPLPAGVPVTLQTFAVAAAGYCLGIKRAVPALSAYLLLGVAGVPVFSGFQSGPAVLVGKTGGFMIGFFFLITACALARKSKSKSAQVAAGVIGLLLCHFCGVLWFSHLTGSGFWAAVTSVSMPFLLKDFLSVAGAMFLSLRLRKIRCLNSFR